MKKNLIKIIKILSIIIVFSILIVLSFYFLNKNFKYSTIINSVIDNNYYTPVAYFHKNDFNIINSYYHEENYDRYVSYKKKNGKYSDDQIINYVNIGIDRDFYTNITPTNTSLGFLMIVNKYYLLDKNYKPDLVSASSKYAVSGISLDKTAYQAFKKLADDAKKAGHSIYISSGYRDYYSQKWIYNDYVNRKGQTNADLCSARAGHSEHQTGLAIDVYSPGTSYSNFGSTKAFPWMRDNCYKYGFILRYTPENVFITGYKSEPWHYRYVGVEVSTYIHNHNITFEEYYTNFIDS